MCIMENRPMLRNILQLHNTFLTFEYMAWLESRESDGQRTETITISTWEGSSAVATGLGIRESFLKDIPNLWTLRAGDIFTLIRNPDGSGMLTKIRNTKDQKNINQPYALAREAIYQNTEKWPENFPYIQFRRIPTSHMYELVGNNGNSLFQPPMRVLAGNLDALRTEIGKKGWEFLTKCGTTKELYELSCDIVPNTWLTSTVDLKSKSWYSLLSSPLELAWVQQLLVDKNPSPDIARALAQSLFPQSSVPPPGTFSMKK